MTEVEGSAVGSCPVALLAQVGRGFVPRWWSALFWCQRAGHLVLAFLTFP